MATKKTFGEAFKTARNKFKKSGSAADYTFKYGEKLYNILQKGETKKGVMEKFGSGASPAKDKKGGPGKRSTPMKDGITRSLRPKLRPEPKKIIKDTSRDPEYAPGNFGSGKKSSITVTELDPVKKSKRNEPGRNTNPIPVKKSNGLKPYKKKQTALEIKVEKATTGLTGNAKKLAAWKAGERTLTMKERGRLYKWARRNGISVPKSLYDIPDNYK